MVFVLAAYLSALAKKSLVIIVLYCGLNYAAYLDSIVYECYN